MKRLITLLMVLGFLTASAGSMPAIAKHGHRGKAYHGYYYRPYKYHQVRYRAPYYLYPGPYYYPYYAAPRPLYVSSPVVYPAWYYPPPSLFNLNLRL